MFAGQAQSMQRAMQHSPMQQSVPSPIRSPYSNTSPSPQHPGFGNQQQQQQQQAMLNNFNRFQQPNAMVPGNAAANAMNNYGYGSMGNYRMQNQSQFMGPGPGSEQGNGNFYNNHYMSNGFPPQGAAGNRFVGHHPNGAGQYYNQMQQQQNFNNGGGGVVGFGNPDFVGGPNQNNSDPMYQNNFANQQNRMLPPNENNAGGQSGQPIPPHFRGNMNMQGSPMGSPIGPPRISPSAMHKPMPGVGMPRASQANVASNPMQRQQTPLVSPQSMHSDHSASSPMHNNPLTPQQPSATTPGGLQHGGITSPMYNPPRTPSSQQYPPMMSPSPRSVQVPLEQSPMTEDMKSPNQMLKSPLPYTSSNLRKIRRPSKPSNVPEEASPLPPEPAAAAAAPSHSVRISQSFLRFDFVLKSCKFL